ncbi:MAG TPA: aspartate 1-decarboxylase autocleavage activator PanM [Buttiauxella sp.]|uniref:aspartate 1-decarboxylase autocleavage activator PanM n=1 Tax=Buttiauxella sp. TaxID=1972222 RepID=UPI002B4A9618|nr:aspartate 1-decarboxylase autocleavage activator PanM [Buttiauxella sp.]HKM98284.1 aspartate 1-decarboxylase autocleavage activator PanM [Buttiauxella sp.]
MKLTIIRLFECSAQDEIDLAKIWPEYSSASLTLSDTHRIYAAKFNDRLLGAVRVTLADTEGALDSLRVREITRRRGVGQYLVEEVIRDNPGITRWWMNDIGVEDRSVMAAFMQTVGFTVQDGGWGKSVLDGGC